MREDRAAGRSRLDGAAPSAGGRRRGPFLRTVLNRPFFIVCGVVALLVLVPEVWTPPSAAAVDRPEGRAPSAAAANRPEGRAPSAIAADRPERHRPGPVPTGRAARTDRPRPAAGRGSAGREGRADGPASGPKGVAAALGGATDGPDPVLRRRPAGLELPDTIGTLLSRRMRTAGSGDAVGGTGSGGSPIRDYLLYLPPGLDEASAEWPLILYLHGRSLRGGAPDRVKRYGLPSFLDRGWDVPFVVVAPHLPAGRYWSEPERLLRIVDEVVERHPVDRERLYLTGFSLGAGGVWEVLRSHADAFAAAVPISAWTPTPEDGWDDALGDLPLRLYHGTEDEPAPYARALHMARHLDGSGADVELITLRGRDHGIVQDVYGDPDLYRWMLRQR